MLYRLGKVVNKNKSYLIFESNNTGYVIHTPNVDLFEIDKFQKIFIYEHQNDYIHTYYGFKDFKERLFFEDLLSIPGIGPKTALGILSHNWNYILELIINGEYQELAKLPYVSIKIAKQIVLEFQAKYKAILAKKSESKNKLEVYKTLKTLGFNQKQIDAISSQIQENDNLDLMVEQAIELISNAQHNIAKTQ